MDANAPDDPFGIIVTVAVVTSIIWTPVLVFVLYQSLLVRHRYQLIRTELLQLVDRLNALELTARKVALQAGQHNEPMSRARREAEANAVQLCREHIQAIMETL